MPQFSENKYLQALLENLIASYETEVNYNPLEIELDAQQITAKDIRALSQFVTDERKRLFVFKIPGNEQATKQLSFLARRTVLNKTAETILKNTSNTPKINPLKYALNSKSPAVRARIQIQKSFEIPKPPSIQHAIHLDQSEQIVSPALQLSPLDLPDFPELVKQLRALGIDQVEDSVIPQLREHGYAFRDGIIPNNLPKGFYINKDKKAFCYTDSPKKIPTALAPVLKKQDGLILPSVEEASSLLPLLSQNTINALLASQFSPNQKNILLGLLPAYEDEITALIQSDQNEEFLVPLLCKQYLMGGESHSIVLVRLLTACLNKKINLECFKTPEVQNALLSTRGIKNLQKLVQLPAEQKEWWNTLVASHLNYDPESFDFNVFFEAYTQIFLPRIAEKNLTLPNPCPINHKGHLLITLNRVLDVIEHAQNPQEQCLSLSDLNWGPTGVHYAMLQKPAAEQFKQVADCMKLENPEDSIPDPEPIYQQINNEVFDLKPWIFRYFGQNWKKEIRLSDIQAQLFEIEKLASWTSVQKNQLTFILTCTFANKDTLNPVQWREELNNCIQSLQVLEPADRNDLLQAFSRSFKFKANFSFAQINTFMKQCIEFKTAFPEKHLKDDFITPLVSCLENEGPEILGILQERIQKTDPAPQINQFSLAVTASFTTMLLGNRETLSPDLIKLLAKLNQPDLAQDAVDNLVLAIQNLKVKKNIELQKTVLHTLSQINISKSQELPKIEQIQSLIDTLANSNNINIPAECNTPEKQEEWFKNLLIEQNLLKDCVVGNGDISKLDDLIVDALVDAIKKRSAVFEVNKLKQELEKHLQNYMVPQKLREQLSKELMPLFDAVHELVTMLQMPNPQFPEVLEKFRFFEEKKPMLLEGTYSLILGETKGEYILSFLLTGKRKANDQTTGKAFASVLGSVHNLLMSQMRAFFENPRNKQIVKDLDLNTCFSWMEQFNETHSLTFFFKEELIQKKVVPALKKTLHQLNTQDLEFEKSILDEAASIDENAPSHLALQNYKDKIESIANYLNLLIDINDRLPQQFIKIYKQLNTGLLARLNFKQKQILVGNLIQEDSDKLDHYLKLTTQALEEYPNADPAALERAINGLVELFKIQGLEPETQTMFFKMSMAHNLRSASPFPLAALNELKKADLPEETKSLIIKKILQILVGLSGSSAELVQGLIQQTQLFLTQNQDQAELCIALLHIVSHDNPNHDLANYPLILQQLTQINPENRTNIIAIVTGLAKNKKDPTVNLPALLEVTKGLGRRSAADVGKVLKLFATPPYPNAQSLNTALLAHDSTKLHDYCSSFDTNPFAKTGETRDLAKQFATNRIKDALVSLQDMLHEEDFPHALQMKLARQLTFIETLGYTDPLNPNDFTGLKKLTACSRHDLKIQANALLQQLRSKTIPPEQVEVANLELLAYLREIYFRTTGLFPNTTQMLVLLLALHDPSSNLLMRIKTGEGKSINTPMLSVLQWSQGGTVDQCTANPTLLIRDYENSCEPFFKFLGIKSALIQSDTPTEAYQINGINCSTGEDMSLFRLAAKEAKKEGLLETSDPVHIVLDECDDALLDQVTLHKLVAETEAANEDNPEQWIYPLAHQFINLPAFRKIDPPWDEDEDLDQFRIFLNKQINEQFNGNVEKQNYLMASSNTQLKQWIHASCVAQTLVENKHFIVQPIKEKDETGHEVIKKIACVPLIRSTPKHGSIFTEAVQQALQARLKFENKDQAQYIFIDRVPSVLASQSIQGLIKFYQKTKGRLLGISATPGDKGELESLATSLGTQAISVAPYAGDKRKNHEPIFTFNREETIKSIQETFERIKCPVTKPTMELNPDLAIQTFDEHATLITQSKQAIEKWSHTQTQPILIINEDFDEAEAIGNSLKFYKEQGFKIQIITGKESPSELDKIIKQAGQVNTITVGTAMLAKGIDINTGDHPKGLFVIQTYADTQRMTTQIAGRAARNGKPGDWLPIYQVKPPENMLKKFFYYILPWVRQSINEQSVEELRNKIKLQATVDRIYTQAIDEVQQVLMQQIEAWESLLLEFYPDDPRIKFEFYQWRETILSELTRSQDPNVTQTSLNESIEQFKKTACKLWENAREEKWAAKADKAVRMSFEQSLRLKFLKQLDFFQELNIQSKLQQKPKQFKAGVKALMHQNLETVIADKAGVVLEYTKPEGQTKNDLELAQSKQILPHLIGEFCAICPDTIKVFFPKNTSQNSYFIPEIVRTVIYKLIEQKNRVLHREEKEKVTESVIQFYQSKLMNADDKAIRELLSQIKPLLLNYCEQLTQFSLVEQFKVQGLILSFSTLYRNSGLPEDENLNDLQKSYDEEIMKKLAQYLMDEFAWVQENPEPLHALFERTTAKNAALEIYTLAGDLINSPQDKDKIQRLYATLERHRTILKDKYLFSIRHSSPREVINDALNAIDSLNSAPHCDLDFRQQCHDQVIAEHQIDAFRNCLSHTSPHFFKTLYDPTWEHLKSALLKICNQSKDNPTHIIHELYEATLRFSSYKAYHPYLNQLNALKKQLLRSIEELDKPDGLNQDAQESLLAEKQSQFAALFNVKPEQVHIQSGNDGIQSYIDFQIEDAPLQEGFTGYESSFLPHVEAERNEIKRVKSILEENKEALLNLSDVKTIDILPSHKRAEFAKLFRLKAILALDWDKSVIDFQEFPEQIRKQMEHAGQLKQLDWKSQPVNVIQLKSLLGIEPDLDFALLLNKQLKIQKKLDEIQKKKMEIGEQIGRNEKSISDTEYLITKAEERMEEESCSYWEKITLKTKNLLLSQTVQSVEKPQAQLKLAWQELDHEEIQWIYALNDHNVLLDRKRMEFIKNLLSEAKEDLASYLDEASQEQITAIEKELGDTEPLISKIAEKEIKKTQYQSRRFFKPADLLKFQATLTQEESQIPLQEGTIGEVELNLDTPKIVA